MGEHEDRTFIVTFIGVIVALIGITIALIILAASTGTRHSEYEEERLALQRERVEERLQPVGAVRLSGEPMPAALQAQAPAAEAAPRSPEQVVQGVCAACHGTGVLGAPKIGDTAAWQAVIQQGLDTVVSHAVNGIRAMPPKGGDPSLTDEQVRETVVYMLEESGVSAQ